MGDTHLVPLMFYEYYTETCQKIVLIRRIQRWITESRDSSTGPAFVFSNYSVTFHCDLKKKA